MRSAITRLASLPALAMLLAAPPAHGIGSIVFDPANHVQTTITAIESVESVAQQVQARVTQLQQYRTQLLQLQSLGGAVGALLGENANLLAQAQRAYAAINQLYGSATAVQNAFSSRLSEARFLNMSWPSYVSYELQRIEANKSEAQARATAEVAMLKRAQDDLEFARTMENRIESSDGVHSAMQVMSVQVNRMITQNAELLKGLTVAIDAVKSPEQQAQAAEENRRRLMMQQQNAAAAAARVQAEAEAMATLRAAERGVARDAASRAP